MACVDIIKYQHHTRVIETRKKNFRKSVGDVSKETKRRICLAETN